MKSGIYQILNKLNGNFYIGSAINLNARFGSHKYDLNTNQHHNTHLQRAWNKYGINTFEFKILEYCEPDKLIEREQWYIDNLEAYKIGYNRRKNATSNIGIKWTQDHKDKISNTKRGVKQPYDVVLERAEKLRNINKWPHDEGCRCKCRECILLRNKLQREYRFYKNFGILKEAAPELKIVEPKGKK